MKWQSLVIGAFVGAGALIFGEAFADRVEHGNLVNENIPETPPALRERLRQYRNTRAANFGGWPADGKGLYIITGYGETPQVHFVEEPDGAPRQLTFLTEPVGEFLASPRHPDLFAFISDDAGNENYQVYLFNRTANVMAQISDGAGRKGSLVWSRDGKKLAWYTTLEGAARAIIIADIEDVGRLHTVFSGKGAWSPIAWSPDSKKILLQHYVSVNESTLHLLDIASGALTPVNPSSKRISYGSVEFSHDSKSLFFTSDEDGEFLNLYRYEIASQKKKNLTDDIAWNIEDVEVAPSGKTFAFVANKAGRSTLHVRTRRNRALPAPQLPLGVIDDLHYSPDGARLGFTLNAPDAPGDVFTWRVGRFGGRLEPWVLSETGGLDPAGFVDPAFFSYPTFDNVNGAARQIPAFMYKPEGKGPHPVILRIHGGPERQSRPVFSPRYQFWAKELGLAVVLPNVRGSNGYGKSYLKLDNGMKREDSVKDIGALLDWIAAQPDLDASRVIVYGGSYGGYMALASMVHFDNRLAGGVDIVGISNFITFLENTSAYRRDLRRQEYGDERDPEMRAYLQSISPLNHADQISKPILIVQGLNDPRVPARESEQIFNAVRANGGEPWYMLAKNEGHGFKKKSNLDARDEAVVLFFAEVFGIDISGADVSERTNANE